MANPSDYTQLPKEDTFPIKEVFGVLLKRKKILFASVFLCGFLGIYFAFTMTPVYQANATVVVGLKTPEVFSGEQVMALDSARENYYKTQTAMLKSRSLAKIIIQKLDLDKSEEFNKKTNLIDWSPVTEEIKSLLTQIGIRKIDPAHEELKKDPYYELINKFLLRLKINLIEGSHIVEIGFQGYSPELAAKIVNTFTDEVIARNIEFRSSTMGAESKEWIQENLVDLKKKIAESEKALIDFKKNRDVRIEDIEAYDRDVREARSEEKRIKALIDQLKNYEQDPVETLQSIPDSVKSRTVHKLIEDYSTAKKKFIESSKKYKPQHPEVISLTSTLKLMEEKFPAEINRLIKSIELDYKVAQENVKAAERAMQAQKNRMKKLGEEDYEFNALKNEFDSYNQLYNDLLVQFQKISISSSSQGSDYRIVDRAEVPSRPIKPKKGFMIFLSVFFGFLGGGLLVYTLEANQNSLITARDIEREFPLPFLGTISIFTDKTKFLPTFKGKDTFVAEEFRILKTNLELNAFLGPKQVLMVSSSNPNEGKTTVTSNLAVIYSQQGKKVLIIDADFIKPTVNKVFKTKGKPGLINYLEERSSLDEVIMETRIDGISIIPGGSMTKTSMDNLKHESFGELFKILKNEYDIILVDTPPALAFAYVTNVAQICDGVLFVVGSGVNDKELVGRTLKQLCTTAQPVNGYSHSSGNGGSNGGSAEVSIPHRARIVGIVLNKANQQNDSYYYHKKYFKSYYETA
jgi:capsular exopolysaccharide synthesis family protein